MNIVLSIFPGVDLLGRGFEAEGFTILRGPDPIFGGDIHSFHPPQQLFDGVIGGPPCQAFSALRSFHPKHDEDEMVDLIPEFCRVVSEAQPRWWLMENVRGATDPIIDGYVVESFLLNNRWMDYGIGIGGNQNRLRKFWFGTHEGLKIQSFIQYAALQSSTFAYTVLAGHGAAPGQRRRSLASYTLNEMCELQGLPSTFADKMPFTVHGKKKVIGNGVPVQMARILARSIRDSIH